MSTTLGPSPKDNEEGLMLALDLLRRSPEGASQAILSQAYFMLPGTFMAQGMRAEASEAEQRLQEQARRIGTVTSKILALVAPASQLTADGRLDEVLAIDEQLRTMTEGTEQAQSADLWRFGNLGLAKLYLGRADLFPTDSAAPLATAPGVS